MIASEILMSMGSTTASILNGPMSLSPTAMRLSVNVPCYSWLYSLHVPLLSTTHLDICPNSPPAPRGGPGSPSSRSDSRRCRAGWLADLGRLDRTSSWSEPPHICPSGRSSGSSPEPSDPPAGPGKMSSSPQNFFSAGVSVSLGRLQTVGASSYFC